MIGFIGLGIMGSRMAANLLNSGFELVVYNRTKEKAESLIQRGATWADSPREVAQKAEIVFTMLSAPDVVDCIALGENGFFEGLNKGKLWVDCSTVNPSFTRKMAKEAKLRGIRFMDAPVTGSKAPAEKGELVFLVGGEKDDLGEIMPMLKVMGKDILYQGEVGRGSSLKIVINLMLAQSMVAFAEALNFAEIMGLEKEMVMDTLLNGPTAAPFLKGKKDKILTNDYSADFPLDHIQKDLQLVAQTAFENQIAMPSANLTKEIYALAKQHGLGKQDFSAVYRYLSERV
jgi:3-hydroxyisobutyrate dehydrogenase-like beta-hydroxyacid dehydrogenase